MAEREPPLSPILDYDNVPGKHRPQPLPSTLATTTTHGDTTNGKADERTRLLQDLSRSPPLPKRPRNPVGLDSEEFSFEKRKSIPNNVRTCITVCIIVLWLLAAIVIVVLLYFAITGKFDHNNNTHKRTVDDSLPFSDDSVMHVMVSTTILTTQSSTNASLTTHGIKITQQWPETASGFLLNCTADAPRVYASWSWNRQSTDLMMSSAHDCATVADELTRIDCGSLEGSMDVLVSGDTVMDSDFLTIVFCAEDVPSQVSYSVTLYGGDSDSISAKYDNYSRSPAMSVCFGGVAIIFLMVYLSVSLLQARIS